MLSASLNKTFPSFLPYLLNFAKIQLETNKVKKECYVIRQDNTTPAATYEGENTVMMLQTARYKSGRKEGNVLFNDALNTFFIYGFMASNIWLRTRQIAREETRSCHMGYSFRLAARVLIYASSHQQDNTYHSLC